MPALAEKFRAKSRRAVVPPRAVRVARAPKLPAAASLAYQLRARQVADAFARRARTLFRPVAKRLAELEPGHPRPSTAHEIAELKAYANQLARSPKLGKAILQVGKEVARHNATEFARLGIDKLAKAKPKARTDDKGDTKQGVAGNKHSDLGLDSKIDAWRAQNVSLITGALGEQADKIAALLNEHHGSSYEVIARKLEERFGITSRRAELIARDQVLTLNAQVNRERMQRAGINRYVWTTTGDERVRGNPEGKYPDSDEDHWSLDGNTYSFSDPPIVNPKTGERANPGEPIQCRCVPYPATDDDIFGGEPEVEEEPPEAAQPSSQVAATAVTRQPTEVVEGVHVKRLELKTRQAKAAWERFKKGLTETDVAILKATPLESVTIKPKVSLRGSQPNGFYVINSKELSVRLDRQPHTYGQEFKPGAWSVSYGGTTAEEAAHRTLVHELGHHVHFTGGAEVDRVVQESYKVGKTTCLTKYGQSAPEEYFAECFAMHRFHPELLESLDPNGANMVRNVLALRERPTKTSIWDI